MTRKILSLLLAFAMMIVAAITVNKTIFGHEICKKSANDTPTDTITTMPDGTIVVHTAPLTADVQGFAGTVPLNIHIQDNKITTIEAEPNTETPSFMRRASAIFSNWIGKTPAEAASMHVDGVSGATFTSNAIIANVNAGLSYYDGYIASQQPAETPLKIWVALIVTLAACIVPLFVKNKIYHTVQMVANAAVLGFWAGQFLDYALMLKYLSHGIALPSGLVAIAMLVAAFIYPIFGHPQHYCTHICPLGAAQQLAAQLCGYKIKLSAKLLKSLNWFRKILWAVLMLMLWFSIFTEWMDFELFQAFQIESASWWIIGAACIFVALSAIVARPYCRFVCPTGSLFKQAEGLK